MGYNSTTPWDLAELKKESFPIVTPIFGSSSFGAHPTTRNLVDLKLGRLGDSGEGLVDKFKAPHASVMNPSSRSSRKARSRGNISQFPSCLVDGCRSDLSTCRDYHQRHKVCEAHSKTPVVTVGGQVRRFCQQCSRFHSLVEFDDGKRSCRKRLDGHNRRRRKPQPLSITLNPATFLPNHPVKAEHNPIPYTNGHSLISFADRKTPFPGAHGGANPILAGDSFSDHISGNNRAIASDRVLSLLSTPPSTKPLEFGLFSNAVHTNTVSFSGYGDLRPPSGPERGSFLNCDGGAAANLRSQVISRPGTDGGSPAGMPHQTLFFSWE